MTVAKKLACESQWVKWKMWTQSWHFRTLGIHEVEAMQHLRNLQTVAACPSNVRLETSAADFVHCCLQTSSMRQVEDVDAELTPLAKWLLLSCPCRMETAPGFSPWGLISHAALCNVMLSTFQTTVAKKLACESQWVKWKMCKQLRLPHVLYSQSQGYAALRNTAKCPSNVRWRRLQTYAFVV